MVLHPGVGTFYEMLIFGNRGDMEGECRFLEKHSVYAGPDHRQRPAG